MLFVKLTFFFVFCSWCFVNRRASRRDVSFARRAVKPLGPALCSSRVCDREFGYSSLSSLYPPSWDSDAKPRLISVAAVSVGVLIGVVRSGVGQARPLFAGGDFSTTSRAVVTSTETQLESLGIVESRCTWSWGAHCGDGRRWRLMREHSVGRSSEIRGRTLLGS